MKHSEKGFTLIELVIVIVLIGILAATAAPKFLNLEKSAKVSVMQSTAAAVKTAVDMFKAKAEIPNELIVKSGYPHLTIDDVEIEVADINNRYPLFSDDQVFHTLLDIDAFPIENGQTYHNLNYKLDNDGGFKITPKLKSNEFETRKCFVEYNPRLEKVVNVETSEC